MKTPVIEIALGDLPATLRHLRKEKGLTLKEVAADIGMSHSFISDVERGRTRPSLDTVYKLAKRYHTYIKVTF